MSCFVVQTATDGNTLQPFPHLLPARWVVCVDCPQSHPCVAVAHLMPRSAVGGASVTVASVSAGQLIQESSMGLSVSVTTGSAPRIMENLAMVGTTIY